MSNLELDNRNEGDTNSTRRGFLARAAVGAATVPAALALTSSGVEAANNNVIPSLYGGWNARNFAEIRDDENDHVRILRGILGVFARPKPTFRNLVSANAQAFVTLAQTFENTGVGAYLGVAAYIDNIAGILPTAASIAQVEAYHSGYLNTLLNDTIVPQRSPLAIPIAPPAVVNAVSPFIASLNGGTVPVISSTPSYLNDIAILNYALLLEYLEAEFYNINVSRFFRGA